jgi:hypothetical protein
MGESRLCLFCLEKRTHRQKIFCVENLFSCECRVYCHAKCIKKWHRFCGDDLQCPICRCSIHVPEPVQHVHLVVIDLAEYRRREFIKNMVFLSVYMYCFLYVYIYFTYQRSS